MILDKIYLEEKENNLYICADVYLDNKVHKLWYSTDLKNKEYISLRNGDAFILILFIYAIFNSITFESKVPISKELHFGLIHNLLPVFGEMKFKINKENFIFHEIDEYIPKAIKSATAMSFGVDSFYTYINNLKGTHKIDCLTLFNAGAFGQIGGEECDLLFSEMKEKVRNFSQDCQKEFIWVDTNTNEFLNLPFVKTHTFRNFACALLFQNLFQNYFYASGVTLNEFRLNSKDPAYYDIVNSKAIRSNNMFFHISGLTETRLEKTRIIAEHNTVQDNLNVCLITPDNNLLDSSKKENCSKCFKCIRTMSTLEVIGQLNNFNKVFDINSFKMHKNKHLGELLYRAVRMKDVHAKEIFEEIKIRKYKLSPKIYYYFIKRALLPITNKLFKNA